MNYFGLRGSKAVEGLSFGQAVVVEDHSHDPWSGWAVASRADYCLLSLRKTLPLGHGGAAWSPQGHPIPDAPPLTPDLRMAAEKKLAAMLLKRLYLRGERIEKPVFRRLQEESEKELANGTVSGITTWGRQLLGTFPWQRWRSQRETNHRQMVEALTDLPGIRILSQDYADGSCPFALVLVCETNELRERLRSQLLAENVYPAVYWPVKRLADARIGNGRELSQRLLAIPCDYRYGQEDLQRVADAILKIAARPVPA
jgi:hypothetical protein